MNHLSNKAPIFIFILFTCLSCETDPPTIDAQLWHGVTLSFEGPELSETDADNPFLNYRLNVTFTHENKSYTVPGFYAADGNAAESSATSGKVWQVRFTPDETGEWTYKASFRKGENIAVNNDPNAGEPLAFDGKEGSILVTAALAPRGFHKEGRLDYVGERYLKFAGTGKYFLKGGTDSPENFMAYQDFDDTYAIDTANNYIKTWEPHVQDWQEGDPVWQNDKGKGIIGALNYLHEAGVNSFYFLTMNIGGDGKDVWPYINHETFDRFDCSKLDQWEIVFSHAENLGIMLHFVLQETENELLLDNGETGTMRKLYYRELIARFGHHLAITWNLGEENGPADFSPEGQTTEQQKAMLAYIKEKDPYHHFLVIHTHAYIKLRREMFQKLLGDPNLDGPSLQLGNVYDAYEDTRLWIESSAKAGKQWVVNVDEIGHYATGVVPDALDIGHDSVRQAVLWPNLMAGGGGVEWYFGATKNAGDLDAQDLRTRADMWKQTRNAIDFFQEHVPFPKMKANDDLIVNGMGYALSYEDTHLLYFSNGLEGVVLNLPEKNYRISWFDPKVGGDLQTGSETETNGGTDVSIGSPPSGDNEKDWVVLLRLSE